MGDAAATLRSIGVTGQLQQSQHCPQWNDYGDWIDWRAFSPLQHKLQGSVTWGFWMKNCDFNEKHQGKMVTLYKQMVIQIGYLDSVAGLTHWTNGSHYMRHVDMVECAKHFQVQYQHMSMKQSQYVGITITVVFLPLKKTSNFVLTWLNHETRRTKDHLDLSTRYIGEFAHVEFHLSCCLI